jgi:hypothetical protein
MDNEIELSLNDHIINWKNELNELHIEIEKKKERKKKLELDQIILKRKDQIENKTSKKLKKIIIEI